MDLTTLPLQAFNFVVGTLVPFLFVLSVVVFFHELGHFLVARWNRVRVEAFSLGFGPELFGWTDRHGTRWRVSAVPLGGYVKFLGDGSAASTPDRAALAGMDAATREGTFEDKAVWRRALVVAAGPIANFILAIVIYTGLFWANDDVRYAPVVGTVLEDGAAKAAGILPGDVIRAIDGRAIETFADVRYVTSQSSDTQLVYTLERAGRLVEVPVTPRLTERKDPFGNSYRQAMVGLTLDTSEEHRTVTSLGPWGAFVKASRQTWMVVAQTFNFLRELILGKQDATELRGPIGIAQITSQVATLGFQSLLGLAAVLSISIGILNLFPVPMLDGGHLVFYAVEAVRGRKLSERSQEIAFRIGFCLRPVAHGVRHHQRPVPARNLKPAAGGVPSPVTNASVKALLTRH